MASIGPIKIDVHVSILPLPIIYTSVNNAGHRSLLEYGRNKSYKTYINGNALFLILTNITVVNF